MVATQKAKQTGFGTLVAIAVALIGWYISQQQQKPSPPPTHQAPAIFPETGPHPSSGSIRPFANEEVAESIQVHCTKVVDGDTIETVTSGGRRITVRILGIDTMETHNLDKAAKQARRFHISAQEVLSFGRQAKTLANRRLQNRQINLILPTGREDRDPYNRLLAYVQIEGVDYGAEMLQQGLAEARREPHARGPRYRDLEKVARDSNRGLFKKL